MKTPEQLKGAIRSMAAKKNLRAQEVLQMFLFERIIDRLAASSFRDNFISKAVVKGECEIFDKINAVTTQAVTAPIYYSFQPLHTSIHAS